MRSALRCGVSDLSGICGWADTELSTGQNRDPTRPDPRVHPTRGQFWADITKHDVSVEGGG